MEVFSIMAKPPDLKQLTRVLIAAATIGKQLQR
jgi:hypothetical protein